MSPKPDASIVVPAYNEEATIGEVVDRLLALPITVQVVVVNAGSTDKTGDILRIYGGRITLVECVEKTGKGEAIRKALPFCSGVATIVQDADLEYAPEQIPAIVNPIIRGEATVVYGNRFSSGFPAGMALPNKIVNILLSWAVAILYFRRVRDEATCYKAFRTDVIQGMNLVCMRFEFCPEVTAKAIRGGHKIHELPIQYEPRSKEAGKKIRWTDAPEAFWTLLKNRF